MVTVQLKLEAPRNLFTGSIPREAMQSALRLGAEAAKRDCVRNFDRQGYEQPPGVFHKWKELSERTFEESEKRALERVGGIGRGIIKRRKTPYGILPVAYGKGGEQKTARVRRFQGVQILVDTGRLRASILGGLNHVERIGADEFVIGTNVEYAPVHEKGARIRVTDRQRKFLGMEYGIWVKPGFVLNVPARPFLRLSREGLDTMERVILQELARRGFGGLG